ncbi:MAG: branched-chain amino acid ABC transporter permease [Hyphomicrobiales bacterium]|nr:branched-chain amino acid ABC transporter permease [Hyphomicrobiales bacterium]
MNDMNRAAVVNPALKQDLLTGFAVIGALFAALATAQIAGAPYLTSLIGRIAITSIAALSLSFLIGQAGLVSFGHAAPIGIGAYVALMLAAGGTTDLSIQLSAAFILAALIALITGPIALKTRGVTFIMLTLAFAQMFFYVASSLVSWGGDDGMALAQRSTLFGYQILRTDAMLAAFSIALLAVILLANTWMAHTRFGLVLKAMTENERRVAANGFEVNHFLLYAFVIAAGVAAVSGVLLANQANYVSPAYLNWHRSGELIVIVVLGGVGRLPGAVLASALVILFEEFLGHYTEYWKLGLGLTIVAIVLLRGRDLGAFFGVRNQGARP